MNTKTFSLLFGGVVALALAGAANAGTDYVRVSGPTSLDGPTEGDYGVVTSSGQDRSDGAWGDYGAPAGASSLYFEIFNGSPNEGARFYYDDVYNAPANTDSTVRLVIANNYGVSAPVIQLTVNGVDVGAAQTLGGPYGTNYTDPAAPGPWQTLTFNYNTGAGGLVQLAFIDTNTERSGNDFSVASVGVPEPAVWSMMLFGFFGLGAALRTRRRATTIAA